MPNPGGIQLGCERCRQRRIKVRPNSPVDSPIQRLNHHSAIEHLRIAGDVPFMVYLVQAILRGETSYSATKL